MTSNFEQHLQQIRTDSQTTFPVAAQRIMEEGIETVQSSLVRHSPLQVGDFIPLFCLLDLAHQLISIQTLLNRGSVVLSFYRGTWCPFCMTEFRALLEVLPAIKALQASLVLISPQRHNFTQVAQANGCEQLVVLQDMDNQVAEQFGIVYPLPSELVDLYQEYGVDLSAYNGTHRLRLPVPATYIIEPSGRIQYAFVDADYRRRLDPVEIITILRKQSNLPLPAVESAKN